MAKRQKLAVSSSKGVVNYEKGEYEWSSKLKSVMKSILGIEGFRFHQEGVINATMSGRDVVCIMPTGWSTLSPPKRSGLTLFILKEEGSR